MGKINRDVYSGTHGKVYMDGVPEYYIKEISVEATGNFEDIDCCGDTLKGHGYVDYDVEGTMTCYRAAAGYEDEILDDFDSGVMRERTIVTELTNPNNNKTLSYSMPDVVFTKAPVVDFGKKLVQYTIPFKCGRPKRLDRS